MIQYIVQQRREAQFGVCDQGGWVPFAPFEANEAIRLCDKLHGCFGKTHSHRVLEIERNIYVNPTNVRTVITETIIHESK